MVYLSANGEVIGQFEERELPEALAAGRVPRESFFWREGMPEWRPLREFALSPRPRPAAPQPESPVSAPSVTGHQPEPRSLRAAGEALAPKPALPEGPNKGPFVPRTQAPMPGATDSDRLTNADASDSPPQSTIQSMPAASKPVSAVRKVLLPRAKSAAAPEAVAEISAPIPTATTAPTPDTPRQIPQSTKVSLPIARKTVPVGTPRSIVAPANSRVTATTAEPEEVLSDAAHAADGDATAHFPSNPQTRDFTPRAMPYETAMEGPAVMLAAAKKRGRGGRKGLLVSGLVLLLGALGAAGWWLFPKQPPALEGEVRLAAADGTAAPVPGAGVFLVSREELAARWRERLSEAQSRGAEVGELLKQAKAVHREKSLALELAARTSELADEYNMPDAAELRAARDAAQAEEAEALAELEKLNREKESFATPATLLRELPEALQETSTDESGKFRLVLPEATDGLAVLVLSSAAAADSPDTRGWFVPLAVGEQRQSPVLLSSDNALDADQIKEIAGAQP